MANIQIKRGQELQVDMDYKLGGQTTSVDLSGSSYDVELVIRRKRGDNYDGQIVDTLRFGNSSPADSAKDNRITLVYGPSQSPATTDNIQLKWNTAQSAALPNVDIVIKSVVFTSVGVLPAANIPLVLLLPAPINLLV